MQDTYSSAGNGIFAAPGGSSSPRARLSAFPAAADYVYGPPDPSNIMHILHETNGVVFPYTPNVTQSVNIQYENYSPIHSNQGFYAYKQTESLTLTVSGEFTAQNQREKEYTLAVLHFFRTVSKMRFGQDDPMRGSPPPMLQFSAFGELIYSKLPVLVQNFQLVFPSSVDYVRYSRSSASANNIADTRTQMEAWVPAKFDVVITMIAQKTPRQLRKEFSWERFRNGDLLSQGGWF